MRVKTNLTPKELDLAGRGLQLLAKSQQTGKKYKPENPAEKELLEEVDSVLKIGIESIQSALLED